MRQVCKGEDCQRKLSLSCVKQLACGHWCGGVAGEQSCLRCLHVSLGFKLLVLYSVRTCVLSSFHVGPTHSMYAVLYSVPYHHMAVMAMTNMLQPARLCFPVLP